MLSEIKKWILERKVVSLNEISLHFQVEQSAMDKMMERLEDKGFVRKIKPEACSLACSDCAVQGCKVSQMIFYEIV